MTGQENGKQEAREPRGEEPDDFSESLRKTLLLKQFAVRNGYKVPTGILSQISGLELHEVPGVNASKEAKKELAGASAKLDAALIALTSITFPITADSLAEGDPDEYARFKGRLLWIGLLALCSAVVGLILARRVTAGWGKEVGCSVLAISLGTLGAVVYCFFDALGVVPAQTFNRKDKYPLYARLELGVLLGWVFYLGFARQAFANLGAPNSSKSEAFYLMIPFIAGYSTKFVVGALERIMAALLVALGIEGKREARIKRTREVAPDAPAS
ncbi:MAG TPA: hypothetical protein VNX26_15915 [Candidatus Acidoferrum sp.]|nr:hypothetical protein [Candidatus Acidoferrum sp.]